MPAIRKSTAVQKEERITKSLKKALIDKGWSVQHLAALCGMQPSNLSRAINHPMKVQLGTILMIAAKLGLDSIPT